MKAATRSRTYGLVMTNISTPKDGVGRRFHPVGVLPHIGKRTHEDVGVLLRLTGFERMSVNM